MHIEKNHPAAPRHRLGLDGLLHLKGILGGPPAGWELEQAFLRGTEVELVLAKDRRRLDLRIVRDAGGRARLGTDGRGGEPAGDERAVTGAIAAGLAGEGFAELLARLNRDALLYSDPGGDSVPSRFETYFRAVDHGSRFWKFVHPDVRFLEQDVRFGARYAQISHATLECNANNPRLEVAPLRFFAEDGPRAAEGDFSYTDTDIGEADVVGGRTQEILGRVLERVAREEKPAFIHLKTTCLPELVGDTPAPFIERIERELGVPVLWTSKTRNSGPVYEALVDRLLDEVEFAPARDPKAVILAGLPSEAAAKEAAGLCRGLGLRVVGALFPNLDVRSFPEIGAAGAVVWYDPVGWAKIEDGVFLRRGLRVVRHHPPFGLAGTRAWLARVVSVLGLDAPAEVPAAAAAGLEALIPRCRARTAALIGDAADLELLASRGRTFGFSTAGLLCELGFRVRCLVWSPAPSAAAALRRPPEAKGAGSIEFVPFSTRAGLDRLLRRGVDLAFTHFNHDPRLEAHGLPGFNDNVFEPGPAGLLRSACRLLLKCESRPFARHRACLAPWIS
ncbi:MAG: hypothetical protein HYV14_14295 [Elusimicrobia bacterium]|nr:hypothetical protein [Elusimicrobiota bacterium]